MQTAIISRKIRFANFIIDLIFFAISGSVLLAALKANTTLFSDENRIADRLFSLLFYFIYYLVFELFFKTTPGKFFTKTKVVTTLDEKPNTIAIVLRSVLRIVPFEPLSIFFNDKKLCWHDQVSKTKIKRVN